MRVPVPDEILPADRLGRVHFVGIGGAGLSGIARIMLARGIAVSGSDGTDSPDAAGAARPRGPGAPRPRRRPRARRRHAGRLHRGPRGQPGVRRGAAPGPARAAALGGARVGDGRPPGAGRRRHPRQDHDHLAAHRRPAGGRGRPDVRRRRRPRRDRPQRRGGLRRPLRRRGRRERRRLPRLPPARRHRDQRRGRPPRQLGHRGGLPRGLRRVRWTASTPPPRAASWSACVDDDGAADLARARPGPRGCTVVGVGESADADLRATDLRFVGTHLDVHRRTTADRELGTITLQIPGRHYVLDALAALAVGLRLGPPLRRAAPRASRASPAPGGGWSARARSAGVRVYDSYAHHPVEIAGDLQAARAVAGEGRVVVAFQPHLVSRTRIFGTAMGEALGAADEVVVLDVYLAREDADPAVTGALVADAVPAARRSGSPSSPTSTPSPPSWSPGPAPATWCSPSAPAASPSSAAGARAARRAPPMRERRCASTRTAGAAPRPGATGSGLRTRRRFARRQWARRWLTWRYVVAVLVLVAPRGGGGLGGLLLLAARRAGRRGRPAPPS